MEEQKKTSVVRLAEFIATGFYSGRSPVAPGTAGSAAAMLLLWILSLVVPFSVLGVFYLAVVLTIVGTWAANVVCAHRVFGDDVDPSPVVIDEFAGYAFSIMGLVPGFKSFFIAFLCFRFFDVLKPTPIHNLEKLPAGYGIMFDDVLAGVFAGLAARIIGIYFM